MENIKICSIVSSEWHCGHGFAFIQAIFSLKRMRIPLIRAHFLKPAYWHFVAYRTHRRTITARLGIFTLDLAL
jgi:hypothetical protein